MNIVVLHYHLNHGGVTQVIVNQLRALDRVCCRDDHVRVAVLSDGQVQGWPVQLASQFSTIEVILGTARRLRYDLHPVDESQQLASQLRAQLSALGCVPNQTVLHVHNHSLGKNASLPGALRVLAQEGYGMLLQIHDFAEDYRPRNYHHLTEAWATHDASTNLYPQSEHVHYAVLNQRDYSVLTRAGVPAARLHHLPNPVVSNGHVSDRDKARQQLQRRFDIPTTVPFLLYPVRGIRRKNLGEALLWSVLGGPTVHVGVTLAPLNPAEQPYYQRWKQVACELQLPVHFEIGGTEGLPLDANLAAADLLLTTSVTEGFGMAFLESWLAERTLVGRDLPEITTDFVTSGLQLDLMYRKLRIPIDVIGRAVFHDLLQTSYAAVLALYRRPAPTSEESVRMTAERTAEDTVDFADLDEHLQEQVLRAVLVDPAASRDFTVSESIRPPRTSYATTGFHGGDQAEPVCDQS